MSIGNLTKYRPTWDYSSGIFFTITGVTTIGYGHLTPTSMLGQTVCIIYLLIGIPLMAIYLAGIGGNVSQFIKATMDRQIWVKHHSTVDIVVKMVTVNVLILSLLILLPAIVFTYVEKWTYGESVYYAFITLTTVGFGDFYLGQNTHSEYGVMYNLLTAAWIVVGLAVIATIISEILAVVSPDVHKSEVENTSKSSVLPADGANETQNSQE
ncbi:potassium channel subfamily K member 16-like [Liolophura sinensis]|uniref:potassium channel subfamily K member 16-like n=1 Tax=Liolophura sinensis TaxID=3198878 RepID=UPI0031582E72